MGVSMHSLVRRIPMALGPVLGGAMIGLFGEKTGVRLAFVAALILGGVSLAFQQVMIEDDDIDVFRQAHRIVPSAVLLDLAKAIEIEGRAGGEYDRRLPVNHVIHGRVIE